MAKIQTRENITIDSMSPEGRGVARINGKTVFVSNALPGEVVNIRYGKRRRQFDEAVSTAILTPSPQRIAARCDYYTVCGGCSMQHLDPADQIAYKQDFLLQHIRQQADIAPVTILPPLQAKSWAYRRKARLGVKYVKKKQRVLVGFREKQSSFLADIHHCEILHEKIGRHLDLLSEFVGNLQARDRIPQMEVAVTDACAALVIRHLDPLSDADLEHIRLFASKHDFVIYLQSKGPQTVKLFYPHAVNLEYRLSAFDLTFRFGPADFTQVNQEINECMVSRAIELLELDKQDRVLDLFCGIGNFTLPLAKMAGSATGVEGDSGLIERARSNAVMNNITNVDFFTADLTKSFDKEVWYRPGYYNVLLLDPPRSGAREFIESIAILDIEKILYVSCNPSTLARDTGMLVNRFGYELVSCGVMDMFPQTSHVESIALFRKKR